MREGSKRARNGTLCADGSCHNCCRYIDDDSKIRKESAIVVEEKSKKPISVRDLTCLIEVQHCQLR
ncbi:hypothetical protein BX666DRAFT_1971689 [Dichotomocladium elegans]|nr:hypothetical protein BX666DRAFT_1971689 [Dichotomocladium elegans]